MSENRTVAIVGLGVAARTIHLPALAKLSMLTIVGGCDPAGKATDFPFPLFSTPQEMLDKTHPDILIVATPPASHFNLTQMGLEAGSHVFCEKPFTETLSDADALIDIAHRTQRWIVVNNQYRFMNIHRKSKTLIGRPEFGKLIFLAAHQTFHVNPATEAGWRGTEIQRTGKEFATHVIDLCRFFFAEDPISVFARMPKPLDPQGPDYLNLIQLEFSGDRVAHIILDRLSRGRHRYLDIRLDGTEACIETHLGGGIEFSAGVRGGTRRPFAGLDVSMGGRAHLYRGETAAKIASDPIDVFAAATGALLTEFIAALDRGDTPPCSAEDNRSTLAAMLAAYESQARNEACIVRPRAAK